MLITRINREQLRKLLISYIKKIYRNFSPLHRISFAHSHLPKIIEVEYKHTIEKIPTYTNSYRFEEGETIILKEKEIRDALALWLKKKIKGRWQVVSFKRVLGKRAITEPVPWEFPLLICAIANKSRINWYIEPIGESNDAIAAYLDRTTGVHEAHFEFNKQPVSAYWLPKLKAISIMVANQDRFNFVFNVFRCGANGNYQRLDIDKLKRSLRRTKAVKGAQLSLDDIPTL